LLIGLADAASAGEAPRYRFKAGERYIYEVRIEADLPDTIETTSGHSFYTVRSTKESSGEMTLRSFGSLRKKQQRKPNQRFRFRPPFPLSGANFGLSREVTIQPNGRVVRCSGSSQLPFLLGNLWQLVLFPLPEEGQQSWQTTREVRLIKASRRPRRFRRPSSGEEQSRTANETVDYTLGEATGETVAIKKKQTLTTVEKTDGKPALEQTTEGHLVFDLGRGVPELVALKSTITSRKDNNTYEVPVTVAVRLLDKAEAEKVWNERQAALDKARAAAAARKAAPKTKAVPGSVLEQTIADLKANEWYKVKAACDKLAGISPTEEHRATVAATLEGLLTHDNGFVRPAAAKALGTWGTKDSVLALIAALDGDALVKGAAIKALGGLKDPRAAEALAKLIPVPSSRHAAAKALKTMGSMAEDPVLPLLNHADRMAQMEACRILTDIGTAKSVAPLEALLKTAKSTVAMQAKRALKAIAARHAKRVPASHI